MSALLAPGDVDPRGLRFAAGLTSVVLAVVLVTESATLLAAQTLVFAVGAFAGVRRSPYSLLFTRLVRPRLSSRAQREDAQAPQFAQAVGFAFAVVGLTGFAFGVPGLGPAATALALAAAFLNAAFGLCLGCELYLIVRRIVPGRESVRPTTTEVSA